MLSLRSSMTALLFFLILAPKVYADSPKFEINTNVTYQVNESGNTKVTQTFSLTNLTSQYAPESYLTKPGLNTITNLQAFGPQGLMPIKIMDDRQVQINLAGLAVGVGKILSWTIVYDTPDIAVKKGRLWEITLPPRADFTNIKDYTVNLYVPPSFGKAIYSKDGNSVYDPGGASFQIYDFSMEYKLANPRIYPVMIEIPLISDSLTQKVSLTQISPKPINVRLDETGNWLASYQLGVKDQINVKTEGIVQLFFTSNLNQTAQTIYQQAIAQTDPLISFLNAGKIHGFNVQTVEGFYQGKYHVWAQYFDNVSRRWVQVDPALGRQTQTDYLTSLDFDHVAIAKNTTDRPRLSASTVKALFQPRENLPEEKKDSPGIRVDMPQVLTSGFNSTATIYVENYGPNAFNGNVVSLRSKNFSVKPNALQTDQIPPFGTKALKFSLRPSGLFSDQSDIISLKSGEISRNYEVRSQPFYKNAFILTISILFTLGILSLAAQIAWSLFIPRRGK